MLRSVLALTVTLSATALPSRGIAQSDDWTLAPQRVGKVTLGMPVADLYSLYGRQNVRLVDVNGEDDFVPAVQIYLPFEQGSPALVALIAQVCGRYRVSGIHVYSARFRTAKGVGVGSSATEVRRRYDARLTTEEGPVLIVPALGMSFAVTDGAFGDSTRVVNIWTWSAPADTSWNRCEKG